MSEEHGRATRVPGAIPPSHLALPAMRVEVQIDEENLKPITSMMETMSEMIGRLQDDLRALESRVEALEGKPQ